MELYSRQSTLLDPNSNALSIPVVIVGLGGVGSWVAVAVALLGAKNIILADYDVVEETNRNRTLFRISDVGKKKVDAVEEIIASMREDCNVLTIPLRLDADLLIKMFGVKYKDRRALSPLEDPSEYGMLVFDCTDSDRFSEDLKAAIDSSPFTPKHPLLNYFRLTYDGLEVSVQEGFEKKWKLGELTGYEVVPSIVCAPMYLGAVASLLYLEFLLENGSYSIYNVLDESRVLTYPLTDVMPTVTRLIADKFGLRSVLNTDKYIGNGEIMLRKTLVLALNSLLGIRKVTNQNDQE